MRHLVAEFARPPRVIFRGIRVYGALGSAVNVAIGLIVAGEVHAFDSHATGDGRLEDTGLDGFSSHVDRANLRDVDRYDRARAER